MVRPPPLQLRVDNLRPDSPGTSSISLLRWIYSFDWQRLVLAAAICNAIRYSSQAVQAWRDFSVDQFYSSSLAWTTCVTGALYVVALFIEIFGIAGLSKRSPPAVEAYIYLSFGSAAMMTVLGLIYTGSFFIYAEDLMDECTSLAVIGRAASRSTFQGNIWPSARNLTTDAASSQCHAAWSSEIRTHIFGIFIFYLVPSAIHLGIVCTFHYQTVDPRHPTGFERLRAMRPSARIEAGSGWGLGLRSRHQGSSGWRRRLFSAESYSSRRTAASVRSRMLAIDEMSSPSGFSPGPPTFHFVGNIYPWNHDRLEERGLGSG